LSCPEIAHDVDENLFYKSLNAQWPLLDAHLDDLVELSSS